MTLRQRGSGFVLQTQSGVWVGVVCAAEGSVAGVVERTVGDVYVADKLDCSRYSQPRS